MPLSIITLGLLKNPFNDSNNLSIRERLLGSHVVEPDNKIVLAKVGVYVCVVSIGQLEMALKWKIDVVIKSFMIMDGCGWIIL